MAPWLITLFTILVRWRPGSNEAVSSLHFKLWFWKSGTQEISFWFEAQLKEMACSSEHDCTAHIRFDRNQRLLAMNGCINYCYSDIDEHNERSFLMTPSVSYLTKVNSFWHVGPFLCLYDSIISAAWGIAPSSNWVTIATLLAAACFSISEDRHTALLYFVNPLESMVQKGCFDFRFFSFLSLWYMLCLVSFFSAQP